MKSVYEDIITKDVVLRHGIKNVVDLRQVSRFLVATSTKECRYSSLGGVNKVKNLTTLASWVGYLEESYLIFSLERFSLKLTRTILAPKKIYCMDNGIVSEIGTELAENKTWLMENVAAIELMRRSRNSNGFSVFYWKDHRGREVDFLVKEGRTVKQLIQVTFASIYEAVNERELVSLMEASEELKCRNLLILTWDYGIEKAVHGKEIVFVPLWRWLIARFT